MTLFRRVFAVAAILVSLVGLVINFYIIVLPSDRGAAGSVRLQPISIPTRSSIRRTFRRL